MHLSLFILWTATTTGLMTSALLAKRQGFAAGCNPYVLDGTVLRGTCTKEDGTTASSSLELNQCIGNSFGDLVVSLCVSCV
jgi:hypothetical protein